MTTASLVSYNFLAHDACILIIPITLAVSTDSLVMAIAAIATLILPSVAIVPRFGYLAAIPILALFFGYIKRGSQIGLANSALRLR